MTKRNISSIQDGYEKFCERLTSTREHLPTLKRLSEDCNHITEFGVRCAVTTWAFLAARPKRLVSYDILDCDVETVVELCKKEKIDFEFKQENVLTANIEYTDFLFIDTLHTYNQLSKELKLHAKKVKKYIAFHDTVTFAKYGELPGTKGLMFAIDEFLSTHSEWSIKEKYKNNNGLIVIQKI